MVTWIVTHSILLGTVRSRSGDRARQRQRDAVRRVRLRQRWERTHPRRPNLRRRRLREGDGVGGASTPRLHDRVKPEATNPLLRFHDRFTPCGEGLDIGSEAT